VERLRGGEYNNIREKPVMYESGYLFYSPTDKLWEPFVIAQLIEEVTAANNAELSPFSDISEDPMTMMMMTTIFSKRTEEIQTIYFAILLSQEHQ
jgi:hypothetical protein